MNEQISKLVEAYSQRIPLERALDIGATEQGWREALEAMAEKALDDPHRFGYRNPIWDLADQQLNELRTQFPHGVIYLLLLGGHRGGKSEFAANFVSHELTKPDRRFWCADATEAASRDNQQRYIERYLPPEWRPGESGVLDKRRNKYTKVRFSQAGGFTENALVLPNRSECRFKFYEQKLASLQAVALDGFWGDELLPFEWMEEIEWRLVERNGVMLITFTPYEGWNQTVAHFLEGAEIISQVEADPELLPLQLANVPTSIPRKGENVHRILQCKNERARVLYFHSSDNPIFGNWPGVKAKAKSLPRHQILMRVYGMVEKGAHVQFPMFNERVHVISLNQFYEIQKSGGVWYHFLDPCSGRNWFQLWIFVDPLNRAFVAGESPSFGHRSAYIPGIGDPGPWAATGDKADGIQGTGQKEWGWGYSRYIEEIDRMERLLSGAGTGRESEANSCPQPTQELSAQKIHIEARWIDARYGNARKTTEERSVTMIEEMSDLGMDFLAAPSEKMIDSGRGGGDGSLRMINGKLFYDTSKDIDLTNTPKLFVVETCPNTIFSLKNWSGRDGQHGASKDPVDCLRMYVLSGVEWVDPSLMQPRLPWMAQFKR